MGKSTLMKAIAANKVDGFPPPDQLRTVYVEHDIQGASDEMSVVDYVLVRLCFVCVHVLCVYVLA